MLTVRPAHWWLTEPVANWPAKQAALQSISIEFQMFVAFLFWGISLKLILTKIEVNDDWKESPKSSNEIIVGVSVKCFWERSTSLTLENSYCKEDDSFVLIHCLAFVRKRCFKHRVYVAIRLLLQMLTNSTLVYKQTIVCLLVRQLRNLWHFFGQLNDSPKKPSSGRPADDRTDSIKITWPTLTWHTLTDLTGAAKTDFLFGQAFESSAASRSLLRKESAV